MRVMVPVKASKDSEAGVMPTQQMWEEMIALACDVLRLPMPRRGFSSARHSSPGRLR